MTKTVHGVVFALLAVGAASFASPAIARDMVESLNACLAAAEQSSNRQHERSLCYWKHHERMASYGR